MRINKKFRNCDLFLVIAFRFFDIGFLYTHKPCFATFTTIKGKIPNHEIRVGLIFIRFSIIF